MSSAPVPPGWRHPLLTPPRAIAIAAPPEPPELPPFWQDVATALALGCAAPLTALALGFFAAGGRLW